MQNPHEVRAVRTAITRAALAVGLGRHQDIARLAKTAAKSISKDTVAGVKACLRRSVS